MALAAGNRKLLTPAWLATALFSFCLLFVPMSMAQGAGQSAPPNIGVWPAGADQYTFHMIGNAHIDPVWLWPWSEGVAVVHSTFRSALDRMNEDPNVTMTTSSSQFYEWVAANDPEMLAEIRKRVEEGRWDLVNGWWVEPDVNIPNGESLARQGLYGQEVLQQLFGRTAKVGYNPDSFGHPGSLPQILKLEGMDDYVFMRPGVLEKKIPGNLFWWQGIDGTRALTFRILFSYADGSLSVEPLMKRSVTELSTQPLRDAMSFFGIGDHGGGPTKANMASIKQVQSEPGAPKIFYSSPDRYFTEVRAKLNAADIPVLNDDLQHHSVGCYTAEASVKKGNREAEAALMTAEKIAAVGSVAWGAHYPKSDFTSSWKRILFLQFHDSMAGTALPEQYKSVHEGQGRAIDIAQQSMYVNAQKLAWQVPTTDPDSHYLLFFNPHAWSTTQNIEYDISLRSEIPVTVEDGAGKPIPFQWIQPTTEAGRKRLVVQAGLPAFGYKQVRIRPVEAVAPVSSTLKTAGNVMENEHIRVTFSSEGSLGIYDKDAGREVFKGGATGARAMVFKDVNNTWAHGFVAYTEELGAFKQDSIKLMESGPLRMVMRVHSAWGNSSISTDWILYAGARNLEARVALDWHEHLKMLKYSFPVDVENPKATYEIAYGAMVRATKNEEDPGQRWVDVDGDRSGSQYGFAVINDAKYGYSVDGSDLRVSVARGAIYSIYPQADDQNENHLWQDQGMQTFRMILVPHAGAWQDAGIVRSAEELMSPALTVYQGIHRGTRPLSDSFLSVDVPNVVVTTIKQAEDGEDLIVRMYETAGRETTANLDLKFAKTHWTGKLHPFEIKTLRIKAKTPAITEVNILEH